MLARFNGDVVPFANDATSTNRTVFGGTTQSDNIDDNLNADFKKGWEIVGLNDNPTREDFNAMGYTLGALTSYLYQMGIAEYNALQEYKLNGLCLGTDGTIYQSLVNSNIGNALTNDTKWKNVTRSFVDLVNNQSIDGVKTFVKSPIVPAPTTDFQSVPLKSTNITINVGAGQTYTTINQALEYLSGFYPMYKKGGVTATINLKSGFVMAEQVLVSGIDLGWITIVGEDAETIITHTALTTAFNGNYPAFGVDKGGTSPVIGQLFRFNVEKVGGNKHGLMTHGAGSSANILSGKGFIGAGGNGICAVNGSTINANSANASNAGNIGIYADRGSTIDAISANCSNAGQYGICAQSSSTINAYNIDCSNAGNIGIIASAGSTINAEAANCSNARGAGVVGSAASAINIRFGIIQNQTTVNARIIVEKGSHISAQGINTTGGNSPVFNQAVNTLTSNGIIYQ